MAEEDQVKNGVDIDATIAGQHVVVKNVKSLNTILTAGALAAACFGVYLLMQHQAEAKEGMSAFVNAMKEQTKAIRQQTAASREQTCIMRFDQKDRQQQSEFCKSVSGVGQ